jgi:adenylate cyclase
MERRLAAILAADLVGYSRLMGEDEEGTLARLRDMHAALVGPALAEHRGRIVKSTGDGFLAEFASAVDAVNFAVQVQRSLAGGDEEEPLVLRIGINVGDVIFERDDIFGDGVNIAARLEGIATPGGICISRTVYDHLGGKGAPGFRHDGSHELKNIARPVEVWHWEAALPGLAPHRAGPSETPSLAVLPFDNMSGDPEQGYFADGLAEDLITLLSKLAQLTVIARNSSFSYKGRSVKVQEIARDLGVRYLVEGSVRKAGNRVRVTAQLIDCRDGGHLWAERYDRDLTDIFEVQDEVTREIVNALSVKLAPGDAKRLKASSTGDAEVYELFLQGRETLWHLTPDGNQRAIKLLQASWERDPSYAPSGAMLSLAQTMNYVNRWVDDPADALAEGIRIGHAAVAADPTYPYAHTAIGNALLWSHRHDEALVAYERAIELDPNFAIGHMTLGWALHFAGRSDEGIRSIQRGMLLDPNHAPMRIHWLAQAEFQLGLFEEAAAHLRRRLGAEPHSDISRALLASALGHLGQADEAQAEWAEVLRTNPGFSIERRRRVLPYKNPADFDLFTQGLQKAGIEV